MSPNPPDREVEPGTPAREVTSIIPYTTLSYVERAAGTEAVQRVLEVAGQSHQADRLMRDDEWISIADTLAIARAAERECGDPEIGRRTGEEMFRIGLDRGLVEFLRAAGTPEAAMEICVQSATKMSVRRVWGTTESSPGHVVVSSPIDPSDPGADSYFCGIAAGYYSMLPSLFGCTGTVTQPECSERGDDRCLLVVSWDHERCGLDPEQSEQAMERSNSFVAWFEKLQSMASELALAEDISTVLDRIVQSMRVASMAPRYLLAVRLEWHDPLRVHHIGFDEAEARAAAEALLSGSDPDVLGVPLSVEVASPSRYYGKLAAFFPPGSEVSEVDERFLAAYAAHATAALEQAANLESARRNRDRFEALLGLAESLATAGTRDAVADRLAAAIPRVTGCDRASVWLWDEGNNGVRLAGSAGSLDRDELTERRFLPARRLPQLSSLVEDHRPVALTASDAPAALRTIMEGWGLARAYVVPIVVRDQLAGVLAAGYQYEDAPLGEFDVFARLQGVAHHASIAFDNAELMERVRYQALHDGLTGLANRTLAEDRTRQALASAARSGRRVALLFVDLDRFKDINDTLGHSVGDEVLRKVGRRLGEALRASDTVARIGGDEFMVLLPDLESIEDAVTVARKINHLLVEPITVGEHQLYISGSVGIACYPDHGHDYETLMMHADAAMYEAKPTGNTYAVGAADHRRPELNDSDDGLVRAALPPSEATTPDGSAKVCPLRGPSTWRAHDPLGIAARADVESCESRSA